MLVAKLKKLSLKAPILGEIFQDERGAKWIVIRVGNNVIHAIAEHAYLNYGQVSYMDFPLDMFYFENFLNLPDGITALNEKEKNIAGGLDTYSENGYKISAKLAAIKALRDRTHIGLKEAKDSVEYWMGKRY